MNRPSATFRRSRSFACHRASSTERLDRGAIWTGESSRNLVEILDLPVSLAFVLDSSIAQALKVLQDLDDFKISSETSEDELANDSDTDEIAPRSNRSSLGTELGRDERDEPEAYDGQFRPQRDTDALEGFIKSSCEMLASIRAEIRAQLCKNEDCLLATLASKYEQVSSVLHQIRSSSFPSIALPQLPPLPALAGARLSRRATFSQSEKLSIDTQPNAEVPEPPLSALRAFFAAESARLASKIASPSMALENWPEGIQNAINDASRFVQEETERLKDFVADEAEKLRLAIAAGRDRLLSYDELPEAWKNNKYILTGYRFIPITRPGALFYSLLQWHNETVNIYTHLIPALFIP